MKYQSNSAKYSSEPSELYSSSQNVSYSTEKPCCGRGCPGCDRWGK